jgi:acetyl esterase/lipase
VKCTVAQVPGFGGPRTSETISRSFEYLSKQARGEVEPIPFETGKMTGKMARYTQMRINPTKAIGFDVADAAEKIAQPILFVVAEKEELSDNAKTQRAADSLRARGIPAEYHVIPSITHYGIYAEGYAEATKLELAWFDEHLKPSAGPPR